MMRVFITGATGLIGSALVPELLAAGHSVIGLARSDHNTESLLRMGAEFLRGDLADHNALRRGARAADGVIHLAFVHDFDDLEGAVRLDEAAVAAIGQELMGTGRPFIAAAPMPSVPGKVATEDDDPIDSGLNIRGTSARAVLAYAEQGVRSAVVRLPHTVHDDHGRGGFAEALIHIAYSAGVAGYVGNGLSRWPSVPVADAARLFRIALEGAPAGSVLHAVQEEGTPMRDLAHVIGTQIGVDVKPVEPEALGFLAMFAGLDEPASARKTREQFAWTPTGTPLLETLSRGIHLDFT